HAHQRLHDGLRHKLMPIDAPVNNERTSNNRRIVPARRDPFGEQRYFECAGYFEEVYGIGVHAEFYHAAPESLACMLQQVFVPLRLNERNTRRAGKNACLHNNLLAEGSPPPTSPRCYWEAGAVRPGRSLRRVSRVTMINVAMFSTSATTPTFTSFNASGR